MPYNTSTPTVTRVPDPRPPARRLVCDYQTPRVAQPPLPTSPAETTRVRVLSRIDPSERQAVLVLTQAIVEALQGRRPLGQLDRWAHPDVVATIGHLHRAGEGRPIAFRSARVQSTTPTVAEVAVHLVVAGQSRAVALRLIRGRVPGRWMCTRFETALWTTAVTRAG